MTKKEQREFEIFTKLGISSKPKKLEEGDSVWFLALADIITREGTEDLAVVRNNPGKNPTVVRVFNSKGVGMIKDIYPLQFIDEGKTPKHTSDAFIAWAAKKFGVTEQKIGDLSVEQKRLLREKYLVDQQIKKNAEDKKKKEQARKAREAMAQHREKQNEFLTKLKS